MGGDHELRSHENGAVQDLPTQTEEAKRQVDRLFDVEEAFVVPASLAECACSESNSAFAKISREEVLTMVRKGSGMPPVAL